MTSCSTSKQQVRTSSEQRRNTVRVLLVEDFEDARETILEVMETLGYRVTPAEDIHEALHVPGTPDILVCDLGLPDGSGSELLEQLRERPEWQHIPAIALSNHDDPEDPWTAERSGFLRCLRKPVSLWELDRAILELTGRV